MRAGAMALVACVLAMMGVGGCAVGYNSLLFATKTNVGLDVDTKPPTAELSISRVEGVFAPTFEQGKTPPVLASFKYNQDGLFASGLGATFAAGDAATLMGGLYGGKTEEVGNGDLDLESGDLMKYNSALQLNVKPVPPGDMKLLEPGAIKPVFFGTTTSLGIKVTWSGMTAAVPDSLHVGYKRKEMAIAPITYKQDCKSGKHVVETPSLLATIDAAGSAGAPTEAKSTKLAYLQYFATGRAATALALQHDVRTAMIYRTDPNKEEINKLVRQLKYRDPTVDAAMQDELETWLTDGDGEQHMELLRKWMDTNGVRGVQPADFAKDPKVTNDQRRKAIDELVKRR